MPFDKFFDPPTVVSDEHELGDRLVSGPYVFDAQSVLAINVALTTGRPLLVQGPPGSGKSSLARAVARVLRWRFYEHEVVADGSSAELVYRFNERRRRLDADVGRVRDDFSYVEPGVLWWAFDPVSAQRRGAPADAEPPPPASDPMSTNTSASSADEAVVLVHRVDRAPELMDGVLRVWRARSFYVEDVHAHIQAPSHQPGLLILTTASEREIPVELSRQCIVLTLLIPDRASLVDIAVAHGLGDDRELSEAVAFALHAAIDEGATPPTVSDFLDALRASINLDLTPGSAEWQMAVLPQLVLDRALKPARGSPAAGRQCRIFLCHSSGDKPAVRELYRRLRDDGFDPWLDEESILPGQDWDGEIRRAVKTADLVIVCLSTSSISKTGYVQREIRLVLDLADEQPEGRIYVIPAKLEECDVPERLSRWQWVKLFESNGYTRLLAAAWAAADQLEVAPTARELTARRLSAGPG